MGRVGDANNEEDEQAKATMTRMVRLVNSNKKDVQAQAANDKDGQVGQ